MKKNYKSFSLLLGLGLSFFCSIAQEKEQKKDDTFHQPPNLIILDPVHTTNLKSSANIFDHYLNLDKDNSFVSLSTKKDNLNITHQKFQQKYKGVKVEFGTAVIDTKKGNITSLHGEYYNVKELNTSPKLNRNQAFNYAIQHTGAEKYLWENPEAAKAMDNYNAGGELVILANQDSKNSNGVISEFNLVYKFDIYATKPLSRGHLYIDANTGEAKFFNAIIKHVAEFGHLGKNKVTAHNESSVLENNNTYESFMLASGSAQTRYSGAQNIETTLTSNGYTLNDASRKIYTRDAKNQAPGTRYPYINNYNEFTDNDNNWTTAEHSANKDNAALDAHWGAVKTYDYFASVHNRNSYDDRGSQIRSYVHVDRNYDNAFWNGSVMSYGDGSSNGNEGNGGFDAVTSVDVAGHEIAHAITTYTANLAYERESGGLNEGFSDIWGAAIEHFAKGNGNDAAPDASVWLIGDEIDRRTNSPALRSMSNPTSLGQPDTYGGQYWQNPNCGRPTGTNDYCGVHTNSGVLNHWFYLTVAGGSGSNDVGDVFNVNGVGMNKSAKIAYRTLNVYLSANSTFANARAASIQSAKDLYGAGGAEEQAVTNAWHAVNVGDAFGGNTGGGGNSSYCTSEGNSVADEYIGNVQLGSINNASGANGGYADNTSITTNLAKGTSHTITVTPTWSGTKYDEGYAVWIDFNQNNSFEDSGELVWSKAPSQTTSVSGSFSIPSSAKDGATRMRVSMKYEETPTSCETFPYGEVEDYTVVIGASQADNQAPSVPNGLESSDVTETTLTLSWNASNDNVAVTGYDVYRGNTKLGNTTSTSASITGLTKNTTYQFRVKANDAAGNISNYSTVLNVKTSAGSTGGGNTGCTSGISSFPYSEGYENTLGAWTQSTDDDINWTVDRNGTPSGGTGPSSANQGSYYVFVEASGEGTGFPNKQAIINSPCYDLSDLSEVIFSFDYHMYGDSDMGSIALEASTNNGTTWSSLWNETGNKGNSWKTATIDLADYIGGTVQLRFNRITGGTWKADLAIDNVSLQESTGEGSTNICDGVAAYSSAKSYQTGARVVYQGDLYQRTSSGWSNLGACGNSFTLDANSNDSFGPPTNKLSVFPNPINQGGLLTVNSPTHKSKEYHIIDMLGKVVSTGTFNTTINVQKLETGMYILKVNTQTTRFVIN